MIKLTRTDSSNTDFISLVALLDADLAVRDGAEHSFYAQFNTIVSIRNVAVGYFEGRPVTCGAFKRYDDTTAEVKRMFTLPEFRGKGFAAVILDELERWAKESSYTRFVLETGKKQPEALRLYEKKGYTMIPNYGQYAGMENSVCFEKNL
ncbi:MAG: GNAT family N-acetyltransferase [Bacteroidota bacterium]